jgi:transcriptional regulator with XRE-family HTH domain
VSDLGSIVRQARQAAGVTQRQLARRAGTSQAAISRLEAGQEEASFARFEELMTALGLKAEIVLRPIAEHDAEPRRLAEQAGKSAQQRFDEALAWDRFLSRLDRGKRSRGSS